MATARTGNLAQRGLASRGTSAQSHEAADSLEGRIVGLAMGGKLAKAGRKAIRSQRSRGLAVTFKQGDQVIRQHADGRKEVLAVLERPTYTLPRGVAILRGK